MGRRVRSGVLALALAIVVGALAWMLSDRPTSSAAALAPDAADAVPALESHPSLSNAAARTSERVASREASDRDALPEDRALVVHVWSAGQPLPDARVILFDAQDVGRRASLPPVPHLAGWGAVGREVTTDASGMAQFEEPRDDELGVLVLPQDAQPVVAHRATSDRRVRVDVPRDAVVHGRVTVDGAAPAGPVELEILGLDGVTASSPAAAMVLAQRGVDARRARVSTDTTGRCVVRGARSRPVEVRARGPYVAAGGGPPSCAVPLDATSFVLDLRTLPSFEVHVRGRETPALTLEIEAFDAAGARLRQERLPATREHPVRIHMPLGCARLDLLLREEESGRWLVRHTEPHPQAGREVVLVLPDPRAAIDLRVVDESDRPLEGACALGAGARWCSSGTVGRIEIDGLGLATHLVVGATNHAAVEVAVPDPLPDPWIVRLTPATRVEVHVLGIAPEEAAFLGIHVREPRGPSPRARLQGWPASELDASGTWSAVDLPSGVPIRLSLRDASRHELDARTLELEPGEVRRVEFTVTAPPSRVRVRVLGPTGSPLEGAQVSFRGSTPRLWGADARTAADGTVELQGLFAPDPEIEVAFPGCVPRTLFLSDAVRSDIRLEAARELWVRIERAPGAAAQALELEFEVEADPLPPQRAHHEYGDLYRFEHVPRRPGRVIARERALEVHVDGSATDVVLALPR